MVYGFDESDSGLEVWLDAWTDEWLDRVWPSGTRGTVCERHGQLLTAPRGWVLVDRREDVPRLFVPRPVLVHSRSNDPSEPAHRPVDTSAEHRRRRVVDMPTPQLFVDAREPEDSPADGCDHESSSREPDGRDMVSRLIHDEEIRSSESETASRSTRDDDGRGEPAPEDAAGEEWSSLLDATGPLLRRAFSKRNTGRHDPSQELMRPTHRVIDESA